MSNKLPEIAVLRSSLKKQSAQTQGRSTDSDIKRHVTFATPKLPPSKCNLLKQQQQRTSDECFRQQKSVTDAHRKRTTSMQLVELCAKKNKHNEQIVRLSEAQEALVRSHYTIKRMGKEAIEHEATATALLQDAVSLIETDVQLSFEKQKVRDLLDSVQQQQYKTAQELHEKIAEFNEKAADIGKAMEIIEKSNEVLNKQSTSADGKSDLSVAEEMKLLSTDIDLHLEILDSLKQFHF